MKKTIRLDAEAITEAIARDRRHFADIAEGQSKIEVHLSFDLSKGDVIADVTYESTALPPHDPSCKGCTQCEPEREKIAMFRRLSRSAR